WVTMVRVPLRWPAAALTHDTVPSPLLATHTLPSPVTATAAGPAPTGIWSTTMWVAGLIRNSMPSVPSTAQTDPWPWASPSGLATLTGVPACRVAQPDGGGGQVCRRRAPRRGCPDEGPRHGDRQR